ncbi:MAG TPA: glycosyltransferase family 4 protein, partial [Dehalococcoidia bacterium]|nr:glycosyltransferase family 4 protein [Dehalococcoidia bacterium]
MEEFSYHFYEEYPGMKRLVALRHDQSWLPPFLISAIVASGRHGRHITHVHLGDALLTPLAPLFSRMTGAVVTATVHGLDVTRPVPAYRRALARAFRAMPDRIIAVSSYTAAEAAALSGARAHVIRNGVDARRFAAVTRSPEAATHARARFGLRAGPVIVMVGRLVRRKGAAWFIERVLPLLDSDVQVVVSGEGPDRVAVERAAAMDRRAIVLPELSDRDVVHLYDCADLFVAPNIHVPGNPEGYGIAPAEAASAGVPVLVSALQGLLDMAEEAEVPTVPPGDAPAWAAAVRRALADPEWARARRPTRTWSDVAMDYARLFAAIHGARNRIAEGRRGSPA